MTSLPINRSDRPSGATVPRVLAVAGSDPSGGAGIQADLKSIAAAGGYGMAAITALTAQNTCGVAAVHVPPADFLTRQLDVLREDVTIDAVKIGMLATADVAAALERWLSAMDPRVPVVLDPVMVATSGDRLLAREAERAVVALLDRADVVTPNLPELGALLDEAPAEDWAGALDQATRLAVRHRVGVVAKGGHLPGDDVPDAWVTPDASVVEVPGRRVATRNTHGTGCSLSSGLATRYAACGDWAEALWGTKRWLTAALEAGESLRVGRGRGPVDHFVAVRDAVAVGPRSATASRVRASGPTGARQPY